MIFNSGCCGRRCHAAVGQNATVISSFMATTAESFVFAAPEMNCRGLTHFLSFSLGKEERKLEKVYITDA